MAVSTDSDDFRVDFIHTWISHANGVGCWVGNAWTDVFA
jgi:hypothetical protein